MNATSIFLLTFIVWATAKGRLGKYWELAVSPDVTSDSNKTGVNSGNSSVTPSPTLPELPPLGSILN